jgi:2-polyprenyl-3-methyl-5-hydroxy-6-metoxy-1,4-benzoquinol methylase
MESRSAVNRQAPCSICNSEARVWIGSSESVLYRCRECDHCFTDSPSIARVEAYGSDYYLETHRNWFENPNLPLFKTLRHIVLTQGAKNLLDIGCGNGAFLKYMLTDEKNISLKGIDLSDAAPDEGVEVVSGDFLNFEFGEKFDAIVSLAVIEHLSDVRSFARRCHDLLNDNAIACIMTLNEDGILYRVARILRRFGVRGPFLRLYDPHHLNHFSQRSLIRLLTQEGLFKVTRVINHNTLISAIDIPAANPAVRLLMKMGVAGIFLLGRLTGLTYLQTVVVTKVG